MRWLSDATLAHLSRVADWPEFGGTKYRIVERLARGGMGTVYLAEDQELNRQVALKVLNDLDSDLEAAERIEREARIIAQLEHPGIVPVHELGRLPDGRIFYVMKLVRGSRLDQHLEVARSLADLLRIFERICEAVAFAHAHGVVHRDLKPENVMVGSFGEVLVMDWGVAKLVRTPAPSSGPGPEENPHRQLMSAPAKTTLHGTVLGTPAYMAPEQVLGQVDQIDERTDVYALGAILYFLLTRQAPSTSGTSPPASSKTTPIKGAAPPSKARENLRQPPLPAPRRLSPSIPRSLEAICLKAMARERGLRYESATELGADVSRFLSGLAVRAYREGIFERASRLASKYRAPILLVLAYLVMRMLLLFFLGS